MDKLLRGFSPIIDKNTKVLILGSMPSVLSLQKNQYYAHPQNRFWRIILDVSGKNFTLDYEERVAVLHEVGIGLWDSVASCTREGSLDSAIKSAVPNDVEGLIKEYPNVKMVFTNGKKSAEVFSRFNKLDFICLPSTSPANAAYSYERLLGAWRNELGKFI